MAAFLLFEKFCPEETHNRPTCYVVFPHTCRRYPDWRSFAPDFGRIQKMLGDDTKLVRNHQQLACLLEADICLLEQLDTHTGAATLRQLHMGNLTQYQLHTALLTFGQVIPNEFVRDPDFPLDEYLQLSSIC